MVVIIKRILRSLWYILCVVTCIDTHLFVYPSLSYTLFGTILQMTISAVFFVYCFCHRKSLCVGRTSALAIVWIVYIVIHHLLIEDAELYLQTYIISTLIFLIVLSSIIKENLLGKQDVCNGILLIVSLQIVYLILQWLGIIDSGNDFFKLTGTDSNPNVTAICIATSLPIILRKLYYGEQKTYCILLLLMVTVFLLILRCRTAYVGIASIVVTYAAISIRTRKWQMQIISRKRKYFIASLVGILFVALSFNLYEWKKESADSRFFMWKRSCEMIVNNPVGYGYGKYERAYNLYQASYFKTHEADRLKSRLTTACGSAYNDLLEHGVQGGIVGSLLYLTFFLSLLHTGYKKNNIFFVSIVTAFFVMSFINTIYMSITPWFIFVIIAALTTCNETEIIKCGIMRYLLSVVICVMTVSLLCYRVGLAYYQHQLQVYKNMDMITNIPNANDIKIMSNKIGTSEAYWNYLGKYYEARKEYKNAAQCMEEALKYTSSPLLLFETARCYDMLNCTDKAVSQMETVYYMLPKNFSIKYYLLNLYIKYGKNEKAYILAMEILAMTPKNESNEVNFIKYEAKKYVDSYK